MPNARIADLIANGLRDGLVHPGNPEAGQPPLAIPLPFRTVGMPPEMKRNVEATTRLLAEAIVHYIETEGRSTILDTDELAQLQLDASPYDPDPTGIVTVHCRCDKQRTNPLLHLAIKDGMVVIDGPAVLRALAERSPECPHEVRK